VVFLNSCLFTEKIKNTIIFVGLVFFSSITTVSAETNPNKPKRIVSINLCTDQLLMALVETERIISVSHLSRDPSISSFSGSANTLHINYGTAEEVYHLKPDLVLAGEYSKKNVVGVIKKLGLNIVTVEVANSLKAMRSNLLKLAAVLGEEAKGKTLVSKIDNLFLLKNRYTEKPVAIVWRARGLTDGRGSLVHDLLQAHGFRNLSEILGRGAVGNINLEQIIIARPELVIIPDPKQDYPSLSQLLFKHPALRSLDRGTKPWLRIIKIPEWGLICGGPQVLKAFEVLASARLDLLNNKQTR
jgi:iron complex transport system substrate-binding protein